MTAYLGTEGIPEPPSSLLSDGVIELRLLRVIGPHSATNRSARTQFLAGVPEYRFAIHRLSDGLRVGRIHIRVTTDTDIVHVIGHSGYAVDEARCKNGYASRAVVLIVGLARFWQVLPLWILIEPENTASCRTVERAGFELVDVVNSSAELTSLGIGPKVCRYYFEG